MGKKADSQDHASPSEAKAFLSSSVWGCCAAASWENAAPWTFRSRGSWLDELRNNRGGNAVSFRLRWRSFKRESFEDRKKSLTFKHLNSFPRFEKPVDGLWLPWQQLPWANINSTAAGLRCGSCDEMFLFSLWQVSNSRPPHTYIEMNSHPKVHILLLKIATFN